MQCYSTQTPDQVLVTALKNGDERAFDYLYYKYYVKLFRFLCKTCQSPETAEDLAHEVFIRVWNNRHRLDETRCFSSYLFTIAKHQLLNYLRNQKNGRVFLKQGKRPALNRDNQTEQAVIFADYVAFYERVVERLPPHKRRIFLLRQREGKTHQEIADSLQLSKKTVEFHLRDCLRALRRQFSLHTDVIL